MLWLHANLPQLYEPRVLAAPKTPPIGGHSKAGSSWLRARHPCILYVRSPLVVWIRSKPVRAKLMISSLVEPNVNGCTGRTQWVCLGQVSRVTQHLTSVLWALYILSGKTKLAGNRKQRTLLSKSTQEVRNQQANWHEFCECLLGPKC